MQKPDLTPDFIYMITQKHCNYLIKDFSRILKKIFYDPWNVVGEDPFKMKLVVSGYRDPTGHEIVENYIWTQNRHKIE